jgi:hypothetical protein
LQSARVLLQQSHFLEFVPLLWVRNELVTNLSYSRYLLKATSPVSFHQVASASYSFASVAWLVPYEFRRAPFASYSFPGFCLPIAFVVRRAVSSLHVPVRQRVPLPVTDILCQPPSTKCKICEVLPA